MGVKGINDSLMDAARRWCGFCQGIPAKINLIPFNSVAGRSQYECSDGDWDQIREIFSEIIFDAGYASPVAHAA